MSSERNPQQGKDVILMTQGRSFFFKTKSKTINLARNQF